MQIGEISKSRSGRMAGMGQCKALACARDWYVGCKVVKYFEGYGCFAGQVIAQWNECDGEMMVQE